VQEGLECLQADARRELRAGKGGRESLLQLVIPERHVLHDVVEKPGNDHLLGIPVALQDQADVERSGPSS